jgi:hypothetical protein
MPPAVFLSAMAQKHKMQKTRGASDMTTESTMNVRRGFFRIWVILSVL